MADDRRPRKANDFFYRFCQSSSGGIDLNVAGSSSSTGAIKFTVAPDSSRGESLALHHVTFNMLGEGMFLPNFFGASTGVLTTGIKVEAYSTDLTTVLCDFLNGETVAKNSDFSWLTGVDNLLTPATSAFAVSHKSVDWHPDENGAPVLISQGGELRVTIQDDISSSSQLTEFRVMVQGVYTQ